MLSVPLPGMTKVVWSWDALKLERGAAWPVCPPAFILNLLYVGPEGDLKMGCVLVSASYCEEMITSPMSSWMGQRTRSGNQGT